jgi:hypothetical protein
MRKLILSLAAAGALLASGLVISGADAMTRAHGTRAHGASVAMHAGHHGAVHHTRHVRVVRHFGHRHVHFARHHFARNVWRSCSHVWNGRYHRAVRCTTVRRVRVG